MKVAFRVDASLQMGSGHVMRCLTLADALTAQGAQCHFISREHPGHLLEVIRQRGYMANRLAALDLPAQPAIKNIAASSQINSKEPTRALAHAAWLGCDWQIDAQQTGAVLAKLQPDWLVVDHYALDWRWEESLAPHYQKLMVIDDLADRAHCCDLLLDQNLGSQPEHYAQLVPAHCRVLAGPTYALLRPEFAALRAYSLQRRQTQPALRRVLITMGGVDQPNATGQVLQALKTSALPQDCQITVVMGLTAPWLENVRELADQMPWPTEVVVNVPDMGQRMADSDLAIGAAGSTSWERCCLGLPTLMVVLAENQRNIASALASAGAAIAFDLNNEEQFAVQLTNAVNQFANNQTALLTTSQAAAQVTNGLGTQSVAIQITLPHTL